MAGSLENLENRLTKLKSSLQKPTYIDETRKEGSEPKQLYGAVEILKRLSRDVDTLSKSLKPLTSYLSENKGDNNHKAASSEAITELYKKIDNLSISNKKVSTRIINLKSLRATSYYKILEKEGQGIIRELVINCPNKFNIYIVADDMEIFNIHASYDDLATITDYTDNIAVIRSGSDYIITVKKISFTKSIGISIDFTGEIVINNIFCIYDLYL